MSTQISAKVLCNLEWIYLHDFILYTETSSLQCSSLEDIKLPYQCGILFLNQKHSVPIQIPVQR